MPRPLAAVLTAMVLCAAPVAQASPGNADTILYNGRIFTGIDTSPFVAALAIRGSRVEMIGDAEQVRTLAGPKTKQIDLGGRLAIPGLNDAHMHIGVHPASHVDIHVETDDPSWTQVQQALGKALATPINSSLLTLTIGPTCFLDTQARRSSLDRLSADHPIGLFTNSGHGAILNSAALRLFHVSDDERDPLGGKFTRDSSGKLDGVILEYSVLRLAREQAEMTPESEAVQEISRLLAEAGKFGITSLQDMSDEIVPAAVARYLTLAPANIRVRVIRMPLTTLNGRDVEEGGNFPRHPAPLVTVSGIKWMLDGTPVERASEVTRAGETRSWPFPLTFPRTEIAAMLAESLRHQDQLMVHVSGSLSTLAMLDAMDASGGAPIWSARRVRFEHGDGLLPELIPRAKHLGVVVIVNPSHLEVGERATRQQLAKLKPFKSLIAAGIPVALGSDGPLNPFLNIMLATTFPDRPSEAVTREEAVIAYTRTAAYAEFMEREKGTLEPGKLADIAVLSKDIFAVPTEKMPTTESILTIVGGRVIYDSHVL